MTRARPTGHTGPIDAAFQDVISGSEADRAPNDLKPEPGRLIALLEGGKVFSAFHGKALPELPHPTNLLRFKAGRCSAPRLSSVHECSKIQQGVETASMITDCIDEALEAIVTHRLVPQFPTNWCKHSPMSKFTT